MIRGRSFRLRRLQSPSGGILRWLALLGPGVIAGAAGNDAGGIATYSQAGAQFGYSLLWVMLVVTISLAVVQEMSGRLGVATGRGLLDLIRERFGLGWSVLALSAVLVANTGLVISEFVGVGAAADLLGINRFIVVPLAAALVWYLVVAGTYRWVEHIFLLLTLVFFAYPVSAIMAHPDWALVARGALIPTVHMDPNFIVLFVALLGTTLTAYQELFQQSAMVEKHIVRRRYGPERADTYIGAIFSNVVSMFMIIATAATLHAAGKTDIATAADAAKALQPIAGAAAEELFAIGLLGASLLAAAVLPLSTAYAISEVAGVPKGVSLDFRRAPLFFGSFTALIVIGAGVALLPGIPVIDLLVGIYVLNGMLLPVILLFILLLINDRRLTGDLANTRLTNVFGWGTFALVTIAVLIMIGSQVVKQFS